MFLNYILPLLFGLALLIQFIFLLGVFTSMLQKPQPKAEKQPGVSIIVAAWNELENLKELLPMLEAQHYPDFEVIVVDDRSSDGTYDYLRTNEGNFSKLNFVHIKALPEHFTAKKYAVTMGIKKASKEYILLTDADCRPQSNLWLEGMVAALSTDKEVVLGFSPYDKYEGLLNSFIRYETFQTAVQYFSFAMARMPFMGVGRNLLYKKELFWAANGFTKHINLLSGDDDLLVNEIATGKNTGVSLDPDTYVWSEPKQTFKEWVTQKRRHLSVGKKYKMRDQLSIGSLWLSFLGIWILVIPTFFANPDWFVLPDYLIIPNDFLLQYGLQHWTPLNNWMRLVLVLFFLWQLCRWLILHLCNKKLGFTVSSSRIPSLDFFYFVYLMVFGLMTIFSNPQKIKWR